MIPVDKTGLKEKLDEAKAIGPDGVTEGSYEKLQNAIQEAEGVYNDPNASQDAVNQQIQKLIGAISGLKPVLSGLEVSDPVKTEYAVGRTAGYHRNDGDRPVQRWNHGNAGQRPIHGQRL